MRKILILATYLLTLHLCQAQSNFIQGTIVYPNKDTVQGWIDYRNWDRNPKKISFRTTQTGKTTTLSPLSILSFSVLNDRYVSKVTTLDKSPTRAEDLTIDTKPTLVKDTVFLINAIKGKVSFYTLKDEQAKVHYFVKKDNNFEELLSYNYVSYENTQRLIKNKPFYKATLVSFFQNDCAEMNATEITKTAFNYTALFALVQKYNACLGVENQFERKEEKGKLELGFVAGGVNNRLQLKYSSRTIVFYPQSKVNLTMGLSLNYIFARSRGKLSLYNELLLKPYKITGTGYNKKTDAPYRIEGEMNFAYLQLYNMLRYRIPSRTNLHFFGNIGWVNGIAVKKEETYNKITPTASTTFAVFREYKNFETAASIGAGATFKHLSGEYRFCIGDGMSNEPSVGTTTKSSFFLLGYTF
ncbi:MAG: hypothetical protein RLZZ292_45 [Bacteroidota bacterium]|jgi:hypothetical protein